MPQRTILVADDDPSIREVLTHLLTDEGYTVLQAATGSELLARVAQEQPDLTLMDLSMPDVAGLEALQRWQEQGVEVGTIVITGVGTANTAIRAMQLGAFDYITKPFDNDDVLANVRRYFEHETLKHEVAALQSARHDPSERIIGNSPTMQQVYKTIGRVARTDATVLIQGETGTGKELIARTLHLNSDRRAGPFVVVSCSTLPESLLESELFGHEKGSFTSAIAQKKGRFELAHRGTIFLDEIGEMSLATQRKLLRVLQEREIERVGGTQPIKIDVRVLAATNRNLLDEVNKRAFREDLYYRLNVVMVTPPPLRERRDDIAPLVEHFLDRYRSRPGAPPTKISEEAMKKLVGYDWPGNVRQLENVIQRAVILSQGGVITSHVLDLDQINERRFVDIEQKVRESVPLREVVADVERQMIQEAIHQQGSRAAAARSLGIDATQLSAKMRELDLAVPADEAEAATA